MTADDLRIEYDSEEVLSLTAIGAVAGVVPLLAAGRNGPGAGLLQTGDDGISLTWQAPGSPGPGEAVACAADGVYVIPDGEDVDKWIRVQVYSELLVAGSQAEVFLADRYNNAVAGDDVTAEEAAVGDVATWGVTLRNAAAAGLQNIRIWVPADCDPRLEISLNGSTWSRPSSELAGLAIASLASGATATLFIRRSIADDQASAPRQLVHLSIAFDAG
jgi:hypothetical protein